MGVWDDNTVDDLGGHIKVGTKKGVEVIKGGFIFTNLDFSCAHVVSKTPKGHIKTIKVNYVSGKGRWLHILMDRHGKVLEQVSDENECVQDVDDNWTNDIKKFGSRSVRAGINKLKDIYKHFQGNRGLFKRMINNSYTMKDTKFNNFRDFITKQDPYDLGDKVIATWETAHNKPMTEVGKSKIYNFVKDFAVRVGDKKGYTNMYTTLEEDVDVLDVADLLGNLFI